MIIDSHQHFWQYHPVKDAWITDDMKVLQRDFMPGELEKIFTSLGIDGCVSVQAAQSEAETEFLLSLADKHDFIKGVVGWVDLKSPALGERLNYFSRFTKLRGFRHIVQSEPAGFMTNKQFIEGVKKLAEYNFTYDLLIYHHQLQEAVVFLQQVNEVKIVVDHLAKPSIKAKELEEWARGIAAVAGFDNVSCKVSGMVTEADWHLWQDDDLIPYLDVLFENFGTDRLMYGSDWPVCLLASSYQRQLDVVLKYISAFSEQEREALLGKNTQRFYGF